jgi:hypothetical protein
MRKWALRLLYSALVLLPIGALANYAATVGSGTNFGSVVIGGVHFASQLLCDMTTANQCAAVSAGGAVKVDNSAVTQPVSSTTLATAGNQATNSATTTHTCSTAGFSELGCLGQIDDDVKTGASATGSAVPAGAIYGAGNASSAEPTKATTGNLTGITLDLAGKAVTSPYANRENQLQCAVTITASTAATTCTGMGAQGANVKIYVTDLCVTRSDAGTTADVFTLNDGATTIVDIPNNGGGGGFCHTYNVPLVVAANTAFTGASTTSISSIHMSATGFKGY